MSSGSLQEPRLLVLGNSVSSCEIIEIAKDLGAYTIAVDYLADSAFKDAADKSYLISTADIDALEAMARQEHVTGVLAGASEFNIDKAIALSERLGLPFYATRRQWDELSNKRTFKDLCKRFGVPVVEEYRLEDAQAGHVRYPVIVKPVDSSAGIGISVCHDEREFEQGCEIALDCSKAQELIIERYLTGDEVVVYYTLQDGRISLSAMCDRYVFKQPGVTPLPSAYIFPSRHLNNYVECDDAKVQRMFKSLGMKNGFLFMQAFVKDGRVRVYEMGYRIAGAQGHKIIQAINGINPLEMLVRFALTGHMDGYDLGKQDTPFFRRYACKLTPVLACGTIARIEGLEEIRAMPGVVDVVPVHEEGDTIDDIGTLKQLLARIFFTADTIDELLDSIDIMQNTIRVFDEDDRDMIVSKFDTQRCRQMYR